MSDLTHFDANGKAHMVNVGDKPVTDRVAVARGEITMQASTLAKIAEGGFGKGDVLGVARLAGIMGAKQTASLIPLWGSGSPPPAGSPAAPASRWKP